MMLRKINRIFLHTSDSGHGDANLINEWHKTRWSAGLAGKHIGYHYVVLNGRRRKANEYKPEDDGLVEPGRLEEEVGYHVSGANFDSIGVCLIGQAGLYTVAQIQAAVRLVSSLLRKYQLTADAVFGHYQAETAKVQGKTCPDFAIINFLELLRVFPV